MNRLLSLLTILLLAACASSKQPSDGWQPIFDGKTLTGWRAAENPGTFSVQDGAIVVFGPRAHLFYEGPVAGHDFTNFEWKAQIKTAPGANSGMFIHTAYQETGWPAQGYEIQVNQTHTDWRKTGSVYAVQDVKDVFVKDDEWYTKQVTVQGKTVTVRVNGNIINQYTEPDNVVGDTKRRLSHGTIAIQGHDPKSRVMYKDIMIRTLPAIAD
jgi:hypothetical protein